MIAEPSRLFRSRIRSRICAWIVTSSAVVGSSAISSFGLQASAIAIITRCRIPPESWCGYSRTRRCGAGMPTSTSMSVAFCSASRADNPWCSCSVSPICFPTVSTGLRLVIGSWKIIEMSLPRMSRISGSDSSSRSRPWKRIAPGDPARRLLDQPQDRHRGDRLAAAGLAHDADRLPALTWNETPSTARTTPSRCREMRLQVLDFEQRHAFSTRAWPSAGRAHHAVRHPAGSPPAR